MYIFISFVLERVIVITRLIYFSVFNIYILYVKVFGHGVWSSQQFFNPLSLFRFLKLQSSSSKMERKCLLFDWNSSSWKNGIWYLPSSSQVSHEIFIRSHKVKAAWRISWLVRLFTSYSVLCCFVTKIVNFCLKYVLKLMVWLYSDYIGGVFFSFLIEALHVISVSV